MYSIGERFIYEVDDDDIEFEVIGDMIMHGKEYLVAQNVFEDKKYIFYYDDLEETIILIDDEDEAEELLEEWEAEYYGTSAEIEFWDDDYETLDDEDLIDNSELYIDDDFEDYDDFYEEEF
ncbi:MAG: hypothetical protein PWP46_130 [Fusobacteriaceae bacterium]|jgi:DNA-directed RNA polymerase subunit delta|nr:hypothetical protein [Fusobacteriales bacterium]MDN5303251.1 hypothetical protein [Fusobacteriaceae bacterium]